MVMTRGHGSWWVGAAVLGMAGVMVSRGFHPSPGAVPPAAAPPNRHNLPDKEAAKPPRRPSALLQQRLVELPLPVNPPHPPGSAPSQEWITTRVAELKALAWFDDDSSLHRILAELRNPLPEIQAAALAATTAFGSREAIPYLEALAAQARDPRQQQDLTDAAEFLRLPTLLESLEPRGAAGIGGSVRSPKGAKQASPGQRPGCSMTNPIPSPERARHR